MLEIIEDTSPHNLSKTRTTTASLLPWYITTLVALASLTGIALLLLGALIPRPFSALLAFTGFLLAILPIPLHRLHAALHGAQLDNEIGKKWSAVSVLERVAVATVIMLGSLCILFTRFTPSFIPAVASFFTRNRHFLGIGVEAILIAGSAVLISVVAIWHGVRIMKSSGVSPPVSAAPYVYEAPSFEEIFAIQLEKAHLGRITFGTLFGIVLPLLTLLSLQILRPARLLESIFAGMTGLTVVTTILSAFAVVTLMTCITHLLDQRVEKGEIDAIRRKQSDALAAAARRNQERAKRRRGPSSIALTSQEIKEEGPPVPGSQADQRQRAENTAKYKQRTEASEKALAALETQQKTQLEEAREKLNTPQIATTDAPPQGKEASSLREENDKTMTLEDWQKLQASHRLENRTGSTTPLASACTATFFPTAPSEEEALPRPLLHATPKTSAPSNTPCGEKRL